MNIFAEITKTDADQRMVYGYASTEALDSQGERVSKAAMEAALPDYMVWANVREMHKASAVGTTKEASIDDKGLYIQAKVVDDAAWEKVKEGVYKGFSIGGKATTKVDGEITALRLTEISLVDRPANPECKIDVFKAEHDPEDDEPEEEDARKAAVKPGKGDLVARMDAINELADMVNKGDADPRELLELAKRAFDAKQRKKDAKSGAAEKDGSFPIENESDLKNAIKAYGRSKDKAKTKAHIIARAKALGLSSLIPDSWKSSKKAEAVEELKKYMGEEVWDASQALSALQLIMSVLIGELNEDENEPGQVADLMAAVERIKSFIASEVMEDNSTPDPDSIANAEQLGDMLKAGARHGKVDKGHLEAIHKAVVGMGYECGGAAKADEPADVQKAEGDFAKLSEENELLKAELAKAEEKITALEAKPEEPKGATKIVPVTKGQDVGATADEPDLSKMSAEARALYEMRKAHQNPQLVKI